jgi:hypothetical protein
MNDSKKSVKKLSILLSSELHLRSKRQALLNDQTLTNLIVTLLTNYLDSVDKAGQENPSELSEGLKNNRTSAEFQAWIVSIQS